MHLRFRALARRPGRPIALILATALVLPLAAAPVAATPGSHGGKAEFGAKATRTAKASRTTGRAAAAETATSKRKDATKHAALARPKAFAAGDAGSTAAPRTDGIRPATVAGPGLVSTRGFDGLDQEDAGGLEPPNPWVAVSATHIVQSTEGNIRVSSRAGQELATIASWSLFAVPDGYYATQTRIIWDAFHGRWVGSLTYSDFSTFADNHLVIAVSDGANPLGVLVLVRLRLRELPSRLARHRIVVRQGRGHRKRVPRRDDVRGQQRPLGALVGHPRRQRRECRVCARVERLEPAGPPISRVPPPTCGASTRATRRGT